MSTKTAKHRTSEVSLTSSNTQQTRDAVQAIAKTMASYITKTEMDIWSKALTKEARPSGLGPTLQKYMTTGRELAETNATSDAQLSDPARWPGCVKVHFYDNHRSTLHLVAPRDDEDSLFFSEKTFDVEKLTVKTKEVSLFFTKHMSEGFVTGSNSAQYERTVEIEKFADEAVRNKAYLNKLRRYTAESIESRLKELEAEEKGEGEEGKGGTL